MAVLNMDTEYNIRKAIEIIEKLPEDQKFYVQFYIDNIKSVLKDRNSSLDEIRGALNILKKYTW